MVGFGAYASTFTLTNPASCGLDAPTSGLGAARAYTQEAGSLGYFEVMSQRAGRTTAEGLGTDVPYNAWGGVGPTLVMCGEEPG